MANVVNLDDIPRRRAPWRPRNPLIRIAFDQDGRLLPTPDAGPNVRVWLAEVVTDAKVINEGQMRFAFVPRT